VSLCFLEEVRQTSGKQGLLGHTVIEVVAYIRMQITNLIMNIRSCALFGSHNQHGRRSVIRATSG